MSEWAVTHMTWAGQPDEWWVTRKGDTSGRFARFNNESAAHLFAGAERMREAAQEAFDVLTEPGVMDVDEWKAWQRRTVAALHLALAASKPEPKP